MGVVMKIFGVFWALWIIWYITGGPLRDDSTKKYIGLDKQGGLETSATTTTFKR